MPSVIISRMVGNGGGSGAHLRAELEKHVDTKKAIEALFATWTDPKPYSSIEKIPILISLVKPVNDLILI